MIRLKRRQVENRSILKFQPSLQIHQHSIEPLLQILSFPSKWTSLETNVNELTILHHLIKTYNISTK